MGALSTDRQALAVPDALVAANLDLATDVLCDIATEVTFDGQLLVDVGAETVDFFFRQVTYSGARVNTRSLANGLGRRESNSVDVGQ